MSLFLKNLSKSFYRSIVSSRPVFNKATSLFTSIASHAQHASSPAILAVGRAHNRSISFGNPTEDKKKIFLKRYGLNYERVRSKKTKINKKSSEKGVPGAVTCSGKKSNVECSIDCDKLGEKQSKSKEETSLKKKNKKIVPKHKKDTNEKERCDAKALTGTWVSKKCIKFDFARTYKRDDSTRPIKLEDPKSSKLLQSCKKSSSKELARKASKKSARGESTRKQAKKKKSEDVCDGERKEEKDTKRVDSSCEVEVEEEPKATTTSQCAEKEKKTDKKAKTKASSKSGKTKEDCKACSSKKTERTDKKKKKKKKCPKKKPYSPPKRKKAKKQAAVAKSSKKEERQVKAPPKECSEEEVIKAANSSLIIDTYDSGIDEKTKEMITNLKRELELCQIARSKESQRKSDCVPKPKLDKQLPKAEKQGLLKSVCGGLFSKGKKTPEKSQSTPAVKKGKTEAPVRKTKSADCKIDLNPKYCQKEKKKKAEKVKSAKKTKSAEREAEAKPCEKPKKIEKTRKETAKTSGDCRDEEVKKTIARAPPRLRSPCSYQPPRQRLVTSKQEEEDDICKYKEKKEEKRKEKPKTICESKVKKEVEKKHQASGAKLKVPCKSHKENEETKPEMEDEAEECEGKKEKKRKCAQFVFKFKCAGMNEDEGKEKKSEEVSSKDNIKSSREKESKSTCQAKKREERTEKPDKKKPESKSEHRPSRAKLTAPCKYAEPKSHKKVEKCEETKHEMEEQAEECEEKKETGKKLQAPCEYEEPKPKKEEQRKCAQFAFRCPGMKEKGEEKKSEEPSSKDNIRKDTKSICQPKKKEEKIEKTGQKKSESKSVCSKDSIKSGKEIGKKSSSSTKKEKSLSPKSKSKLCEPKKDESETEKKKSEPKSCGPKKKKSEPKVLSSRDECAPEKKKSEPELCEAKKKKSEPKVASSRDKCAPEKSEPELCEAKKKKSEAKDHCSEDSEDKITPICSAGKIKESKSGRNGKIRVIEECKKAYQLQEKQEEEETEECRQAEKKKDEPKGPPLPRDYSPIMQCIAFCRKKKKAEAAQPGKVPPRDKKSCSEDTRIYKKIAELDGTPEHVEPKKAENAEKKEEVKSFVPCKYEDIKPGIKKTEAKSGEDESAKSVVPCEYEDMKEKVDGDCGDAKQDESRCAWEAKEEENVVKKDPNCPKFKNTCPDRREEKEEDEEECASEKEKIGDSCEKEELTCEEEKVERFGMKKDPCQGGKKIPDTDATAKPKDIVDKKKKEVASELAAKQQCIKKISNDAKEASPKKTKSAPTLQSGDEPAKSKGGGCQTPMKKPEEKHEKSSKFPPCTYDAMQRVKKGRFKKGQSLCSDSAKQTAETGEHATKKGPKAPKMSPTLPSLVSCKSPKETKTEPIGPPDQSPLMQCIRFCDKKKKADTPQKGKVPPRDKLPCFNEVGAFKSRTELDKCEKMKIPEESKTVEQPSQIKRNDVKWSLGADWRKKQKSKEKWGKSVPKAPVRVCHPKPKTRFATSSECGKVHFCSDTKEELEAKAPKGVASSKSGGKEICAPDEEAEERGSPCDTEKKKEPRIEAGGKETKKFICEEKEDKSKDSRDPERKEKPGKKSVEGCKKKEPEAKVAEEKKKFICGPKDKKSKASNESERESKDSIKVFDPCKCEESEDKFEDSEECPNEDSERAPEEQSNDKIKLFVPCQHEVIKPGIRKPEDHNEDDEEEEECEIEIKPSVPCKYEVIKSGLRILIEVRPIEQAKAAEEIDAAGSEPEVEKCEAEEKKRKKVLCSALEQAEEKEDCPRGSKDEIDAFVPCKNEEIKPGIRKPGDEIEEQRQKEDKSEKGSKLMAPCTYEEIKSESQKSDDEFEECEEKSSIDDKDITIKLIVPCKYEESEDQFQECQEQDENEMHEDQECQQEDENKIKPFVPCMYEEIKAGIRKPEDEDEFENCEDELKDTDINEEISKEGAIAFKKCPKFKFICPGFKEQQKAKEGLEPGIRKSEDEFEECEEISEKHEEELEDEIKLFFPCKHEETKPEEKSATECEEIQDETKAMIGKQEEIKSTIRHMEPCKKEDIKSGTRKPEDLNEEERSKSDEIKTFIPCKYEEIKPGIRMGDGSEKKEEKKDQPKKKERVKVRCEDLSKKQKAKDLGKPKQEEGKVKIKQNEDQGIKPKDAKNTSLIIGTFNKQDSSTELGKKTLEAIEQLKREIEECKKSTRQATQAIKACVDSPNLEALLPRRLEQPKSLISGSISFLKSIFNGLFFSSKSKKIVVKSKSADSLKKKKSDTILKKSKSTGDKIAVKEIKSGDCTYDLNPKYCRKSPKEKKEEKLPPPGKCTELHRTKKTTSCPEENKSSVKSGEKKKKCGEETAGSSQTEENKKKLKPLVSCKKIKNKKATSGPATLTMEMCKKKTTSKSGKTEENGKPARKAKSIECNIDLKTKHCEASAKHKKEKASSSEKKDGTCSIHTKSDNLMACSSPRAAEERHEDAACKDSEPKEEKEKKNRHKYCAEKGREFEDKEKKEQKSPDCWTVEEKKPQKLKPLVICSKKRTCELKKEEESKIGHLVTCSDPESCRHDETRNKKCSSESSLPKVKTGKNVRKCTSLGCKIDPKPSKSSWFSKKEAEKPKQKPWDTYRKKKDDDEEDTCEEPPDQSPIMRCIAYCKMKQGNVDRKVKKLVEFYEKQKGKPEDTLSEADKCKLRRKIHEESKTKTKQDECGNEEVIEETDEIQQFAPCKNEEIKPDSKRKEKKEFERFGIKVDPCKIKERPDKKKEKKESDEIIQFVPCKYEEIKSGIRNQSDKKNGRSKSEESGEFKRSGVKVDPCKNEQSKGGISSETGEKKKTPSDKNEEDCSKTCESGEAKEDVPCQQEEIKEVVCHEDQWKENEENDTCKEKKSDRFGVKSDPCKIKEKAANRDKDCRAKTGKKIKVVCKKVEKKELENCEKEKRDDKIKAEVTKSEEKKKKEEKSGETGAKESAKHGQDAYSTHKFYMKKEREEKKNEKEKSKSETKMKSRCEELSERQGQSGVHGSKSCPRYKHSCPSVSKEEGVKKNQGRIKVVCKKVEKKEDADAKELKENCETGKRGEKINVEVTKSEEKKKKEDKSGETEGKESAKHGQDAAYSTHKFYMKKGHEEKKNGKEKFESESKTKSRSESGVHGSKSYPTSENSCLSVSKEEGVKKTEGEQKLEEECEKEILASCGKDPRCIYKNFVKQCVEKKKKKKNDQST